MNEIKVGDKVRVSKDAPKIYTHVEDVDWFNSESIVTFIDGDAAEIKYGDDEDEWYYIAIPTKYLVKVKAESKEPKFKVGDKVKVNLPRSIRHNTIGTVVFAYASGNAVNVDFGDDNVPVYCDCDCLELYTEPKAPKIKIGDRVRCKNPLRIANSTDNDFIGIVTDAVTDGENRWFSVRIDNGATFQTYHESDLELIEPTEQTDAEKTDSDNFKKTAKEWANTVGNAIREYGDAACKIIIDAHSEAYWDAYAADLAKEVAVMLVRTHRNDMNKVAKMSVDIAKAVVDGLKRK